MSNTPHYNRRPYFDDFDPDNQFLRVLFRPGYPVQARELTQLQTMLQDQVGNFGDSIFENGSMVIPGDVKLDTDYQYVTIETPTENVDLSSFVGNTISDSNGLTATLNNVVVSTSDPITLYISYENSSVNNPGSSVAVNSESFEQGAVLNIETGGVDPFEVTVENSPNQVGLGLAVHIKNGIYYHNSLFVPVLQQTLILDKYDNNLDGRNITVGLDFNEEFVTENEDESLLDNAAGSPNFSAPGAHRLKISPALSLEEEVQNDPQNFVDLVTVEDGKVQKKVDHPDYSILEQTLARRTYDESGDYVVEQFSLDAREHLNTNNNRGVYDQSSGGDESKMVYEIDEGKAYVRGFEIEKINKTRIATDKSRVTEQDENVFKYAGMESYIHVNNIIGALPPHNVIQGTEPKVELFKNSTDLVATAYVRQIEKEPLDTSLLRIYLYNINAGEQISNATTISAQNGFQSDITSLPGEQPSLIGTGSSKSIFRVSNNVVDSIDSLAQRFSATANADSNNGVIQLNVISPFEILPDANLYTVYLIDTGDYVVGNCSRVGGSTTSIELQLPSPYDSYTGEVEVQYPVRAVYNNTNFIRSKTQTVTTVTKSAGQDISLDKADVIELISVIHSDSGIDYTGYFTLDGGQRDNSYEIASITTESSIPAGNLEITFRYYQHGSSGIAFAQNTYKAAGTFADNPTYVSSDNTVFELTKCLDFRQVKNDQDTGYKTRQWMIHPNTEFSYDYTYYLGRIDKVVLGVDGDMNIISGTPSLEPEEPENLDNAITLFTVDVPAYTYTVDDVRISRVDQKRYTMKDIGTLERRINNLEYYTSLNLLEQNTENLDVGDRFKSGFIVDNFSGHGTGDTDNPEYSIAMDLQNAIARPKVSIKQVDFQIDESQSLNYVRAGDLIMLPFTEKVLINQDQASVTTRVNPFSIYNWIGYADISPSSDTWISTIRTPDKLSESEGIFDSLKQRNGRDNGFGTIWNSWKTIWSGVKKSQNQGSINNQQNVIVNDQRVGLKGIEAKPITRTQKNHVDDRIVDTSVIPYIREKNVSFSLKRMKPNTRLYVFFDDTDVTEFCTPTPIVTDSSGRASGNILIPNRENIRFRTGKRKVEFTSDPNNSETAESVQTAIYSAEGKLQTIQSGYVSTRVRNLASKSVQERRARTNVNSTKRRIIGSVDPIAESFITDIPGGAYITSIDLYFNTEANIEYPVTVEIRNMKDGYPGSDIIPFGESTVDYNDVIATADASKPTRFNFETPVYIQEDTEYCFVVTSNSPDLSIWVAIQGDRKRLEGDTTQNSGKQISKQPYTGVLFKSQNNSTWAADQTQDIKFKLNRAQFELNQGFVQLENVVDQENVRKEQDPFHQLLETNPFSTENNSSLVSITHENHDLSVGDTVILYLEEDSTLPSLNGITSSTLLTIDPSTPVEHIVESITSLNEYVIDVGEVANTTGPCGGSSIIATQLVQYSSAYFNSETIKPNGTTTNWYVRGIQREQDLAYNATDLPDPQFISTVSGETVEFNRSRIIRSQSEKDINLGIDLISSNDNVSPAIDVDRISAILSENIVNFEDDNSQRQECKYITDTTTLINPADTIRMYLGVSKLSDTDIHVYYKSGNVDDNFRDINWKVLPYDGQEPGPDDDRSSFEEYTYEETGINEFSKFQLKVVLSARNRYKIPSIKDMRGIALYEG